MAAPYTDTGASTGSLPSGANPYGIDPQTMALLQSMGALGQGVAGNFQQPNFQRQAYGAQGVQGQPNNLLMAILQMRAQEAQQLGAPYAQGAQSTGQQPSRFSLLSG